MIACCGIFGVGLANRWDAGRQKSATDLRLQALEAQMRAMAMYEQDWEQSSIQIHLKMSAMDRYCDKVMDVLDPKGAPHRAQ